MTTETQHSTPSINPLNNPAEASPQRIAVISSSLRDDRMSPSVSDWAVAALEDRDGVEVDLIDLAATTLPDDRLLYPGGSPPTEATERLKSAEAFVFVTPEYNHSYPASLKRFIDWHYTEWMFKPAAIVAYGSRGGHASMEHLKGVLNELNVVTVARSIGLLTPWMDLDEQEHYTPGEGANRALADCLSELHWWTDLLSWARAHRPFSV